MANSSADQTNSNDQHRMECMELWGGSSQADTIVTMTGLTAHLFSQPYGQGRQGGDVYYFSSCASGRISRVLLADVTGHGAEVAETAAALRNVMRRNVNVIQQERLMDAVNREFGQVTTAGGFATAVVATYFSPTRKMAVSLAGHPPPFIYCQATGRWMPFDASRKDEPRKAGGIQNVPLGVLDDAAYRSIQIEMGTDDLLLGYTDALIESVGADGQMLGVEGLLALLQHSPTERPSEVVPWLIGQLRSFHEANLKQDDATVLLLRPTGRSIPMKDNLLAPFRLLRGVSDTSDASPAARSPIASARGAL